MQVKVGDKVLFGKYSGSEVELDGEEVIVMREDDIMAILGLNRFRPIN
jgi:chaperonin GroES